VYDKIARLYDPWSRSVVEDVAFYLEEARRSGGPVVELGVGTGRVAVPIAADGIRVIGIDASEGMLEVARERAALAGVELDLRFGDFRDPPVDGTFPLVTIPFRSLLHMQTDTDRRAVLQVVHRLLEPDGRFIFDVFCPAPADVAETHGRWLEREPGIFEHAEWDERRRTLILRVRDANAEAELSLAWLSVEEWRELLGEEGFAVEGVYGWFDRTPWNGDEDSIWVCRRLDRLDRVSDANAARLLDVEVDAEVDQLAVAEAAVVLDPSQGVQRHRARVRVLSRHGAARHGAPHAQNGLAGSSTQVAPGVLLVGVGAVQLEQHPEAARVDRRPELFAETLARRKADDRADVHVDARARLVRADELHDGAAVVRQRLRPRSLDDPAGDHAAPEVGRHRSAELDRAGDLAAVGEAKPQLIAFHGRGDLDERTVVLAVEEPAAGGEIEAAIVLGAEGRQLDRVRMLEPEALDRGDVDAGDGCHR
jgi:SAM-dependent methyltransferase